MSAHQSADHRRDPVPLLPCGVAVSAIILTFSAWGVLDRAGMFSGGDLAPGAAGWLFFAGLAIVAQIVANVAALAARRSRALGGLGQTRSWMLAVACVFAAISAAALHNAFERAGMLAEFGALIWTISAALPAAELAIYWADESLKSRAAELCAEEEEQRTPNCSRQPPTFSDILDLAPDGLDLVGDAEFLRALRAKCMSIGSKATHRLAAIDADAARPPADAVKVTSRK